MKSFVASLLILLSTYNGLCQVDLFQFTLNGDAIAIDGLCYQLTQNVGWEGGSIWSANQIDLNQSFSIEADLNFGYKDVNGADGILFALQQQSTNIGSTGGYLGFGGIVPSLGVEFDTYRNGNFADPAADHIAIIKNGNLSHNTSNTLAGPIQASSISNNIEDKAVHRVEIDWNHNTQTISVYFDCVLRLSHQIDLVNDVFDGENNMYWGFTASTGSLSNPQEVCFLVPPTFNFQNQLQLCVADTVQLHNLMIPINYTFSWSPTDYMLNPNSFNTSVNPPVTTNYTLSLKNDCDETTTYNFNVEVSTCDCNGLFNGLAEIDLCGECLIPTNPNFNQSCADCAGVTNGLSELDDCGECLLPSNPNFNQSCMDCAGITNGLSELDDCGECIVPSNPNFNQSCVDCAGELFGTSIVDTCGICIEPNDADFNQLCIKDVFVPTAFSPNGDGINDVFEVYVKTAISSFNLHIYNRWGEKVFYTNNITESWDGGTEAQSVYVYNMVIEFFDKGSITKKGNLTLLR